MLLKSCDRKNSIKKLVGLLGGVAGMTAISAVMSLPALTQTPSDVVNLLFPEFNPSIDDVLEQRGLRRFTIPSGTQPLPESSTFPSNAQSRPENPTFSSNAQARPESPTFSSNAQARPESPTFSSNTQPIPASITLPSNTQPLPGSPPFPNRVTIIEKVRTLSNTSTNSGAVAFPGE